MSKRLTKEQIRKDVKKVAEWWFNLIDSGELESGGSYQELLEELTKGTILLDNDYTPEQLEAFSEWVDNGVACKLAEGWGGDEDPGAYAWNLKTAIDEVYDLQ